MLTTRRGYEGEKEKSVNSGATLLAEREKVSKSSVTVDKAEQERKLMRENLNKILNYDRYGEMQAEEREKVVSEKKAEPVLAEASNGSVILEEDLRPSVTTMQFGEEDKQSVLEDMKNSTERVEYKMNVKGILVMFLYALAVTVVLALIIINTGVLALLDKDAAAKHEEIVSLQQTYYSARSEIAEITSDEYVSQKAIELGMIKK